MEGLRRGLPRTTVSDLCEIEYDQFRRWYARFASFRVAVNRAESEAERRFAGVIELASAPHDVVVTTETTDPDGGTRTKVETRREFDWHAAESWLKRRRSKEWGDRQRIDVRNMTDEQIIHLLAESDDEGEGEMGTDEGGG